MPQMADIVVKDQGNLDFTLSALTPSSGDTVPARWRNEAVSVYAGNRVNAMVRTTYNGNKSARRAEVLFNYPVVFTDTTTGIQSVRAVVSLSLVAQLPQNVAQTDLTNAVAIGTNFMAATLMKSTLQTGYAPT